MTGTLAVADGWRKTNLTWRPSLLDILPSLPLVADDLTAAEKKTLGLAESRAVVRQADKVHSSLQDVGVQGGDIVIGFDGKSIEGDIGDLLGHVRKNYLVGETITIIAIRGGKRIDLKMELK